MRAMPYHVIHEVAGLQITRRPCSRTTPAATATACTAPSAARCPIPEQPAPPMRRPLLFPCDPRLPVSAALLLRSRSRTLNPALTQPRIPALSLEAGRRLSLSLSLGAGKSAERAPMNKYSICCGGQRAVGVEQIGQGAGPGRRKGSAVATSRTHPPPWSLRTVVIAGSWALKLLPLRWVCSSLNLDR